MPLRYFIFFFFCAVSLNAIGQRGWVNGLTHPVTNSGDLQSGFNGGGTGAFNQYNNRNSYNRLNQPFNNNLSSVNPNGVNSSSWGTNSIKNLQTVEYQYIPSVKKDGNYWILELKDSSNTTRLKGSYLDQELTIPEGMFYYYHSNGNASMYGMYNQGLKNGIWISHYANGKLKDSTSFLKGKKNGPFKKYHLLGTLFVSGNFLEDYKQGTWNEYYQNGQPSSISNYMQNKLVDVVYYTKSGEKLEQAENIPSKKIFFNKYCEVEKQLINATYYGTPQKSASGNYECTLYNMEGTKIVYAQWSDPALTKKAGLFELYNISGILLVSCFYDNNELNGVYRTWHETGIPADSGRMKKNMANGVWESWYISGQKKDSGEYVNHVPVNLWTFWDENGERRTIGAFMKNRRIGDWKTYDSNGRILYIERYRKSKNAEPELIVLNKQ